MLKHWISAFRLRTLFLAVGTVILGSGLALHEGSFSWVTFLLALLLAVSIQILANLANDLGDYQKGTDTTGHREGPERAVQSGKIPPHAMKKAVVIFSAISMLLGIFLVIYSITKISLTSAIILLGLGGACVLAALFYTLGKNAYGYKGWGDFFAFLFFGPVPVIGTYFLHTHALGFLPVLPAIGMGMISAMILNINNMRDIENDEASGKYTLAVKMGIEGAKKYHAGLTLASTLCFLQFNKMFGLSSWQNLYLIVFLFLFIVLVKINRNYGQSLDPYLKLTALSGFLLALLFSICITI